MSERDARIAIAKRWVDSGWGREEVELLLGGFDDGAFTSEEIDDIFRPRVTDAYFANAFADVLLSKANLFNYPQTNTQISTLDDGFIADGSYDGLTEDEKSRLLAEAVAEAGGFEI